MTEKDLDIAIEKCERIMEFDTRTLKDPESENGWLFGRVYDLLKFLRRIELETSERGDTISRTAVLDAVEGVDWYHLNQHGEMVHGANDDEHQAWYKAEDIYKAIESVPPAQPGWIPWDKNTRNSMVNTLQTLCRLAYNIHGVMDAIDDDNVKRLIALLEGGQDGTV